MSSAPSPARSPDGALVLLATADAFRGEDRDLEPLLLALRARGVTAAAHDWRDPAAAWGRADLVVVRSTWDYHRDLDAYLSWVDATAAVTRLANPAELIAWNVDKRYRTELASGGLPVVPIAVLEPGDPPATVRRAVVAAAGARGTGLVVKPAVSAGSRDTARYGDDGPDHARAVAHAGALLAAGRAVLVEPFEPSVDVDGETALVHLDGVCSHVLRKGPMLRPGEDPTADRTPSEELTVRAATPAELAVAAETVAWVRERFGETPLYARVDLLRSADGPRLLELELVEPALFCDLVPGALDRFADAIVRRLGP